MARQCPIEYDSDVPTNLGMPSPRLQSLSGKQLEQRISQESALRLHLFHHTHEIDKQALCLIEHLAAPANVNLLRICIAS